jgi:hypothetical protein
MEHGGDQLDRSTTSSFENVTGPSNGGTAQVVVETNNSSLQEEKERVFQRVEHEMEVFRKGECSRFQASSRVAGELGKWGGASDKEKGKAFDSYLAEINSFATVQNDDRSHTRGSSPPPGTVLLSTQRPGGKRVRDEVEELLQRVTEGEFEGEEGEIRVGRKRAKEEDMPWYNPVPGSSRRSSCVETCRTLLLFSEDLSGAKALLRVADNLPEGIPTTQWDRIIRGESVDLNQILSSMHFVQLDEERKGRVGRAEVVFAVAESKRQVKTEGEWSAAFRRMSKGVAFLFPHRREELSDYAEHVEGLFSAKHTGAHSKVILYDQSVRNQVGGGQNILLTDYQRFNRLSEAILHADGIEYRGGGKGPKGGKGADDNGPSKKDICRRFNGQDGCRFTEEECYYKHLCKKCGRKDHGKSSCPTEKHQ